MFHEPGWKSRIHNPCPNGLHPFARQGDEDSGGADRPVLVFEASQKCGTPSLICVATSENPADDVIVEHVREHFPDVHITRGSEQDVLSRYMQAARETCADVIIRVTSDDPFLDWNLVDRCVNRLIEKKADAVRTIQGDFPVGLDVEVFTSQALEKAHRNAKDPFEREHVGPYIFKTHVSEFAIEWVGNEGKPWPECRLTLDYPEDFELLEQLFGEVGPAVPAEEYRQFLSEHPEVAEVVLNIKRKLI